MTDIDDDALEDLRQKFLEARHQRSRAVKAEEVVGKFLETAARERAEYNRMCQDIEEITRFMRSGQTKVKAGQDDR